MSPSIVALIPARRGSKRIPGKNTKPLGGKPLIQWTIEAAIESRMFASICVCTDDETVWEYALAPIVVFAREPVSDAQTDVIWVREALSSLSTFDACAILRPTSPFRTAETIQRAWASFLAHQPCDSLRAIESVRQHPGKMWSIDKDGMLVSLLPYKHPDGTPWHSSPTQSLRPFYVQNSSLEIAWTKTVRDTGTISGTKILPFFTDGDEGFSIDYPGDFEDAERRLAARGVTA